MSGDDIPKSTTVLRLEAEIVDLQRLVGEKVQAVRSLTKKIDMWKRAKEKVDAEKEALEDAEDAACTRAENLERENTELKARLKDAEGG